MKTPISDFLAKYASEGAHRFHMPGHKGVGDVEKYDVTEIPGADSLYEAQGIIAESERTAGELFGARTFYSAEGSSLCIRAMLCMVSLYAKSSGKRPIVLAGRNAHRSFISAAAMLDIDVEWLTGTESYLTYEPDLNELVRMLKLHRPTAVYVTSPDYLGTVADVCAIAKLCHANGALLLVDNAHGAYLKFLPESRHPIDLGADMCCDSAHKTLPVLTGGAYLHISNNAPAFFYENARIALSLFGSTSPSYLILASLDRANAYIKNGYRERLAALTRRTEKLRSSLTRAGYDLFGSEPLKLTVNPKSYGYQGKELARLLDAKGIVCEFADPDNTVFMMTPENSEEDIAALESALLSIPKRTAVTDTAPTPMAPVRCLSLREAILSPSVSIPVSEALGRIAGALTVACPPAVPIAVPGERITERVISALNYYGVSEIFVTAVDGEF